MLTIEQLNEIKTKIETDKIPPMRAVRQLHRDKRGSWKEILNQLFETFDKEELRSHMPPRPEGRRGRRGQGGQGGQGRRGDNA